MGRKPAPTAIRMLRGNPGNRPLPTDEPTPDPELPPLPADLVAEAALGCKRKTCTVMCAKCQTGWIARKAIEEWQKRAPQLCTLRVLTSWDTSAFEAYCRAWARYLNASAQVKHAGEVVFSKSGHAMPNPYISLANKALKQCQEFWGEFGMTPSARARLGQKGPTPSAPKDPLEKYIRHAPRTG